jgi:deoxycytidylate deaminase
MNLATFSLPSFNNSVRLSVPVKVSIWWFDGSRTACPGEGLTRRKRVVKCDMSEAEPTLPLSGALETDAESARISIPAHVDSWDEYFLNIAKAVSIKSNDPKCPVGAVIVSEDNVVLSTGFNGLARGVHDDEQTLLDADEKLRVICYAEDDAIMNAARVGCGLRCRISRAAISELMANSAI